tara:strand:- start:6043 stop:6930 length:888 start_codon:yes stop_codon:yes gene_type:complete
MQQVKAQLAEEKAKAAKLPEPSWAEMRDGYAELGKLFPADPAASQQQMELGGVPTVRFAGEGTDESRAMLYLHGGGYTLGGIVTHLAITSRLALAAGCPVYALDYRLAPEHPFPAPVDDAVAGFRALVASGVAADRIAIAGDSAGGGLTLACMLALRDAGDAMPACGVPISPWTDITGETGWAHADDAVDPMIKPADLHRMTRDYMQGQDAKQPLASPLFGDLAGLPPLLVQVGTAEILLTDSTQLSEKARAAGVDVTLHIEDGAPHVWHHFTPLMPEGVAAINQAADFVRQHTV